MVFSSSTHPPQDPTGTAPEVTQSSKWHGRWSGRQLPPPGTPFAFNSSQP